MVGLLLPKLRLPAWTLAALALVGFIDSYSRAALYGVALGLRLRPVLGVRRRAGFLAAEKLAAMGYPPCHCRRQLRGVLGRKPNRAGAPRTRRGVLSPLGDESVELRFETWDKEFDDALTMTARAGARSRGRRQRAYRRHSKDHGQQLPEGLVEQGVLGLVLFVTGIVAVILLLARRLLRIAPDSRPVAFAALAGFVALSGSRSRANTSSSPARSSRGILPSG